MSEKKRFLLRLDGRLYDALEKWAGDELRSVNAQIEYILTEAARRGGRVGRAVTSEENNRPGRADSR
jgi:hypothetical protein